MRKELRKLRVEQLDGLFGEVRRALAAFKIPRKGWIREVRQSLGMTTEQLAKRLTVSQPTAFGLEKSEQGGTITLRSLEKAADAMDCDLVYMLLPRTSLQQTLRRQAEQYARSRLRGVAHTMSLEEQDVSQGHMQQQLKDMTERTVSDPPRNLWA